MAIQIDTWGGDLHQNHVGTDYFDYWQEALKFVQERVEEGHLCNVLHTDFKAPEYLVKEAEKTLASQLR